MFRNQNEMISKGNENKLEYDVIVRTSTFDTDEEQRHSASDCVVQFKQLPEGKHIRHTFEDLPESIEYCRICLEGELPDNHLLSSCSCQDPVHEACLADWIEHRHENGADLRMLKCQICKKAYTVTIQRQYVLTCEVFRAKNAHLRSIFCKSLVLPTFVSLVLLASCYLLFQVCDDREFSSTFEGIVALPKNTILAILIMIIIFVGCLGAGLFYKLILQYCCGVRLKVSSGK